MGLGLILITVAIICIFTIGRTSVADASCLHSGLLTGIAGTCIDLNNSECCLTGKKYKTFTCSPAVTRRTKATLTVNGFAANQDGGGASSCDGKYHNNTEMVVALSTGWFDDKKRCGKYILIKSGIRIVRAKVVDECDSSIGCDKEHAFQPPCANNIVDASAAVWKKLNIDETSSDYGYTQVTWEDDVDV